MGMGKIGTVMGKEVIAWTRTVANKSLLATKPVKVNIEGLKLAPNIKTDTLSISSEQGFYLKYKNKLKSLVTDKDGNFIYREKDKTELIEIPKGQEHLHTEFVIEPDGRMYYEKFISKGDEIKFNLDRDFSPLSEETGILVHGTTRDAYNKILKEGFKRSKRFAETFDGIYFTRLTDGINTYGEKQIKCLLKGKVAVGNIRTISNFIYGPTAIEDYLTANNITGIQAFKLKQLLLKDEFLNRGYKGLYANSRRNFAKCKSLVVFNPEDIKIIN